MNRLQLSIALGDYDHVREVLSGDVQADGIELIPSRRPVEEIFYRSTKFREWDVSEMSFAKYVALTSQPDCDIIALPVFPSRAFRHSSIYVREDSRLSDIADLRGRVVGIPEWAQTASVYTRGLLQHEYGVPLKEVKWIQAGVNQAGRKDKVAFRVPSEVSYTSMQDRSLTEMLLDRTLDAIFSARPPSPFTEGDRRIRRLLADPQAEELAYWKRTGVFPIMHVLVVRKSILDRHPWVAMNLQMAFEEAKNRSLARAADVTASFYPLPWTASYAQLSREQMGQDFWPYGVDANMTTLDAFLGFAWEQGITTRHMSPAEIFAPTTLSSVRV